MRWLGGSSGGSGGSTLCVFRSEYMTNDYRLTILYIVLAAVPMVWLLLNLTYGLVDFTYIFSLEQYFNSPVAREVLHMSRRRKLITMLKVCAGVEPCLSLKALCGTQFSILSAQL